MQTDESNHGHSATQEQQQISDGRSRSNGNLKPFPKGVSGNPGGRPKGQSVTAELRRQMEQGETARKVVEALIGKAVGGDMQAQTHHL